MNIENIVTELKKSLDSIPECPTLSFIQYISEFRTIGINLPRRRGKTIWAKNYSSRNSALYYSGVGLENRFNLEIEQRKLRGMRPDGRKYQCIILDEVNMVPIDLYNFMAWLQMHRLLTDDFYVIRIGTLRL